VTLATKFLPHLGRWSKWSLSRAMLSSNKRLGVPCSDIYFIHTPVHPLPLEHWVAAAAEQAKKGHVRALGLSNCNADQVSQQYSASSRLESTGRARHVIFGCDYEVMYGCKRSARWMMGGFSC
jgi:aryl-alcohol dehydrogenase-like predicted oxidoreductase